MKIDAVRAEVIAGVSRAIAVSCRVWVEVELMSLTEKIGPFQIAPPYPTARSLPSSCAVATRCVQAVTVPLGLSVVTSAVLSAE